MEGLGPTLGPAFERQQATHGERDPEQKRCSKLHGYLRWLLMARKATSRMTPKTVPARKLTMSMV